MFSFLVIFFLITLFSIPRQLHYVHFLLFTLFSIPCQTRTVLFLSLHVLQRFFLIVELTLLLMLLTVVVVVVVVVVVHCSHAVCFHFQIHLSDTEDLEDNQRFVFMTATLLLTGLAHHDLTLI